MEDRLLTNHEIDLILRESADPKYQIDKLLHSGSKTTSKQRISKRTEFILTRGNVFTNFDHILVRHHPVSKAGYWTKGEIIKGSSPFSVD